MTPTARTLAECKRRGWTAQVVEKWNPHARVRQDLFGCIDIVAIAPPDDEILGSPRIIGIQATSNNGGNHAAHRAKILAEPRIKAWLEAGAALELWSWAKQGPRGKRKVWTLRVEAFAARDYAQEAA